MGMYLFELEKQMLIHGIELPTLVNTESIGTTEKGGRLMPLAIEILFGVMLLSAVAILILTAGAVDYDPHQEEDDDDR